MTGDVHLHGIPGWVWGFLIVALFFFGVLYMVPELKPELVKILKGDADSKAIAPQGPDLGAKKNDEKSCGRCDKIVDTDERQKCKIRPCGDDKNARNKSSHN